MIYRSNLAAPAITGFRLCPQVKQIMGHDAPSDPDFEPGCTYWTHDEGAILHAAVSSIPGKRAWLDIGSRFGWTAAAMISAGARVTLVDPIYRYQAQTERMETNLSGYWDGVAHVCHDNSDEFFSQTEPLGRWAGFVIDGNHDSPCPLNDAKNCHGHAYADSLIVFHDFWGRPIREGVEWLMDHGWRCHVYDTPNGVAVCWLDQWAPPDHVPDPAIDWAQMRKDRAPEFDFRRCK